MKKINFKKILNITGWILVVSGLITALGFVNAKEKNILGKEVKITVDNADGEEFVDREDVMNFLRERHDTVKGQKLSEISVYDLEKTLLTHPAISAAQVSLSIDGVLKIDLKQRKPLVRIFNLHGESYYIDNKAKLMPLSENYTARVLVAQGNIFESYPNMLQFNMEEIGKNEILSEATVLDDIYALSDYIIKDTLLSSLIQQINVNENKEFELYPAVGDQKIILGKLDNMKAKFEKLKIFYTQGLNYVDGWNKYSVINLKFEDQVVCTKKVNQLVPAGPAVPTPNQPLHEAGAANPVSLPH